MNYNDKELFRNNFALLLREMLAYMAFSEVHLKSYFVTVPKAGAYEGCNNR